MSSNQMVKVVFFTAVALIATGFFVFSNVASAAPVAGTLTYTTAQMGTHTIATPDENGVYDAGKARSTDSLEELRVIVTGFTGTSTPQITSSTLNGMSGMVSFQYTSSTQEWITHSAAGHPFNASPYQTGTNTLIATFSDGVESITLTLKVNVIPSNTLPVITLSGSNTVNVYKGSSYTDAGATAVDAIDINLTSSIVPNNPVDINTVDIYTVTYNVTDSVGNPATQVSRTVNILAVSSSSQVLETNTTVNGSTPEILVGSSDIAASTVTIPDSVTNATINVSAIATSTATDTIATLNGSMTINASTTVGAVKVEIPAGIQITAATPTWNGVMNVPQVRANSTVTVTPDSGNNASVSSVIEVGYGDTKLTFNKAVRLVLSGQAGKDAGYSRNGVFTKISTTCSADTQVAGDALPAEGDCKIDVGSDLVIWTKHFTNFVTYTQSSIPVVVSGGGGGGGYYYPPIVATTTVATSTTTSTTTSTSSVGQVLGASTFNFAKNLNLGSRGDDVTELQNRLTREGVYSGPVTGYFGEMTLKAVTAYQAKTGVFTTGVVGPLTRAKLNGSQVAGASTINPDAVKQAQIKALQAQLVTLMQRLVELLKAQANQY